MKVLAFLLLILASHAYGDPWGKDSDLASRKQQAVAAAPSAHSPLLWLGERIIDFHQNVISPIDHNRCTFRPSCSQYTRLAMRRHGFFKGWVLAFDRLMRDNAEEWVYETIEENGESYKWDPVR